MPHHTSVSRASGAPWTNGVVITRSSLKTLIEHYGSWLKDRFCFYQSVVLENLREIIEEAPVPLAKPSTRRITRNVTSALRGATQLKSASTAASDRDAQRTAMEPRVAYVDSSVADIFFSETDQAALPTASGVGGMERTGPGACEVVGRRPPASVMGRFQL